MRLHLPARWSVVLNRSASASGQDVLTTANLALSVSMLLGALRTASTTRAHPASPFRPNRTAKHARLRTRDGRPACHRAMSLNGRKDVVSEGEWSVGESSFH